MRDCLPVMLDGHFLAWNSFPALTGGVGFVDAVSDGVWVLVSSQSGSLIFFLGAAGLSVDILMVSSCWYLTKPTCLKTWGSG